MTEMKKILVTGAAGFIGHGLCQRLLDEGREVVGLDNLNDYYDPQLKKARLNRLFNHASFRHAKFDMVNLAAQAGVRYSLINPHSYVDTNLVGFVNILEGCRHTGVKHLVYASSSSVYGANTRMPFSVHDNVDHPVSLYAASKKANELMAHSYSHLFNIPTTGLRFFTVYGPWGRPDMALFLFAKAILEGKPIDVFNNGNMERDFTYIDDIVEGVLRVLDRPAESLGAGSAPYRVFNIGNSEPVQLLDFIGCIERVLGQSATKRLLPMQPGDVPATYASTQSLQDWVGFAPSTPLEEGIGHFVRWYREYYGHV